MAAALTIGTTVHANQSPTGLPTISGNAQTGATLTADTSGISDPDGLTNTAFAYQWLRVDGGSEQDISAATAITYHPKDADVGKSLKVRVTFTDDGGTKESLTSAATATIEVPPVISIANAAAVTEGATATFQVSLNKAGKSPVQVSWYTADGTATGARTTRRLVRAAAP